MRHRKSGKKLNRNSSHRQAMFRNMTVSLIEHEVIKTTVVKAKELRRFAEPLITLSKEDTVANRRLVFNRTRSKAAVGKLFSEIGPRSKERKGGYTRILKCGFRKGDAAPMAFIELVDRVGVTEGEVETVRSDDVKNSGISSPEISSKQLETEGSNPNNVSEQSKN